MVYLVLADRDDPPIRKLRQPVEQSKGKGHFEKGKLLSPEAYGFPREVGFHTQEEAEFQAQVESEMKAASEREISPPIVPEVKPPIEPRTPDLDEESDLENDRSGSSRREDDSE